MGLSGALCHYSLVATKHVFEASLLSDALHIMHIWEHEQSATCLHTKYTY